MKSFLVGLACLMALGACNYGDEPAASTPPNSTPRPGATFDIARALIDTADGSVLIKIEIADNDAQRAQGLMGRETLGDDAGMAFIFFEESSAGFWMKDTIIPLSVAFFDKEGTIVEILDMDPCEEEPCPVYSAGVGYYGALEVNQGAFERWGVKKGDRISIAR